MSVHHFVSAILRACMLAVVAIVASGAASPPPDAKAPAVAGTGAAPAMTAQDIEAFLDGLVPVQMQSADIAGVVISIVKDGQVLFAKGYGFADAEARRPVSPENTLFRTGSITKTLTWTAVMQLVEQGKLDLDTDVNKYLDFKLPGAFGKPVTLRNLMTHRGGFEETLKNLGAQSAGKVDLGDYVRNNIPAQIYEPGSTPSYSNYGASLAGYIVERVSGQSFDAYVEENIFRPLGMMHSTLRQPLPAALEPHMAAGYFTASASQLPFEIVNGYPAGSQSSSALDMASYMITQLSGGAFGTARILKPETMALMHDTVTKVDPRLNGIALGFYEETRNGMRIIGHGGDTMYFHSDMHLVPSQQLGFFISYNSAGRADTPLRSPVWKMFLDRYFPQAPVSPEAKTTGLMAKDVAGTYQSTRRAERSMLRLVTALSQPVVTANPDGSLTVSSFTGLNGQPRTWEPLGEGVFQERHGSERIIFEDDGQGGLRLLTNASGVVIFQRVEGLSSGGLSVSVLSACAGVLLLNVLLWPVAAFVRGHYGVEQGWTTWEKVLRAGSMAACTAALVFAGGIGLVLATALQADVWDAGSRLDGTLRLLQYAGYAAIVLSAVAAWNAVQAWFNPIRGLGGRLKETLVIACLGGLLWMSWSMNFFDPALRF